MTDGIQTARLGTRTDITVTRLGLNLAAVGSLGALHAQTGVDTVRRAWSHGMRLFDAAPSYGGGAAELRAATALAGQARDQYILATKAGRSPDANAGAYMWADGGHPPPIIDFSYAAIHRSLEQSMHRLGVDRVDVLHLHNPVGTRPAELRDGYRALAELRSRGVIGAISVGADHPGLLAGYAQIGTRSRNDPGFDCFLLARRYTLLDQSALDLLLPRCAAWGIGVLAAGVFHGGLLAEDFPRPATASRRAGWELNERAATAARICGRHGVPLRAAAMQFPLAHPAVTSVVINARSAAQVDDLVAMFGMQIPARLWSDLRRAGLLRATAPAPP